MVQYVSKYKYNIYLGRLYLINTFFNRQEFLLFPWYFDLTLQDFNGIVARSQHDATHHHHSSFDSHLYGPRL